MKKDDDDFASSMAFLGRGVLRTLKRDVITTVAGAALGAILGLLAAVVLSYPLQSLVKIGALLGAFIGLASRSVTSKLFEYDEPGSDKDKAP
ncbi:hypothetical protein [Flavimaricola marinus]|uniref:Uncharacterized protein n=1 Tax=Flavimaricola marinus TaxID=1819565 RepID=A0A238LAH1_9RHOB|nr:hypothetical protein [Flavimaricola marinus]SMY05956.1 hypothetical protein LOM8899_00077 [Flavimaricola marinus]